MLTPEGRVKKAVTTFLNKQECCWFTMPVVSGYGKPLLDYIGCSHGRFFAIETKAPGGLPTPRQKRTIEEIEKAGGKCWVIDSTDMNDWPWTIPGWFR